MKKINKGLKYLILLSVFSTAFLTACGRKEVDYISDEIVDTKTDNTATISDATGDNTGEGNTSATDNIRAQIGADTDWRWKENIEKKTGTVSIAAEVYIPDVNNVYTLKASKYFYDNDYKKNVMEAIFEKDSVEVDIDSPYTISKENLNDAIADLETYISNPDVDEKDAEQAREVIEYYKDLMSTAPLQKDIPTELGSYEQENYLGTIDGITYRANFHSSKDDNLSYFSIRAKDYTQFNNINAKVAYVNTYQSLDNKCAITEEEAIKYAEDLVEKLGIKHMEVDCVSPLFWIVDASISKPSDADMEVNGYEITFRRSIDGTLADNSYYMKDAGMYSFGYPQYQNNYEPETIMIDVNDNGLIRMYYGGIMTEGEECEQTKILAFEKIKDSFRELILNAEEGSYQTGFRYMKLVYFRMKSDKNTDEYIFIPVWVLKDYKEESYSNHGVYDISVLACVNAIDGTPIDFDKTGNIQEKYPCSVDGWFLAR